jgi:two-component system NtrC family sensor kinase
MNLFQGGAPERPIRLPMPGILIDCLTIPPLWRLFLLLFALLSAAFFTLWWGSLYVDARLEHDRRSGAALEIVHRANDFLLRTLITFAADLRIVASDPNVVGLAAGNNSLRRAVARRFLIVANEKLAVAQLRYIDARGNEVVRVDRRGDTVQIVDDSALQNKSSRYYFRQSIDLPPGGLFVSSIDLNVENGKIVQPWQPTLRLVVPIPDMDGRNAGIVIVNLSVERMLRTIESLSPPGEAPVQILNSQGYWLTGRPPADLWGFMHANDATMARTDPSAWQRIAESFEGTFDHDGTFYAYQTLHPPSALHNEGRTEHILTRESSWKILGTVAPIDLTKMWQRKHLPLAAIGFAVIAAISFGWSRTIVARRNADAEKLKAEKEMLRIEKLASLGDLVAGVSHELNTPIGNAVTVASSLAGRAGQFAADLETQQLRRSTLNEFLADLTEGTSILLRSMQRASDLISNLKQVAVDQASNVRRKFEIGELIGDVAGIVRPAFKHGKVALVTNVASRAMLDNYPGPLGQVLLNLLTNARIHGFDEDMEGTVTISVRDRNTDELEIAVQDTGKGIEPENLNRIFEPFYTTRLGQGGSGLGLAITYQIVTTVLGGTIHAESRFTEGTTMVVRIPRVAPHISNDQTERAHHVA